MSQGTRTSIATLLLLLGPALASAGLPPFGTPSLVADLAPGSDDSSFRLLLPTPNGAVFFLDQSPGRTPPELWATDGTEAGTTQLAPDRLELPIATHVRYTERFVYLDGVDPDSDVPGIWRTDGTEQGTVQVAAGLALGPRARSLGDDGTLVFLAQRPAIGGPQAADLELWVSDGTAAGTRRLRDFLLSPGGVVGSFVEHGDAVYYLDDAPGPGGIGLWKTDGTEDGTELVRALGDSSFRQIWETDSGLYLLARRGNDLTLSLWMSDGTADGTAPVQGLGAASVTAVPIQLLGELDDGRTLWAFATQSVGPTLWVSDGTSGGTMPILDLAEDSVGNPIISVITVPLGGLHYFAADDGENGREIWKTDGTVAGTEIALETAPGPDSALASFRGLGDRLYLTLESPGSLGREPSVSDGTAAGTDFLGDLCPGPCSSDPLRFTELGGATLFLARDGLGRHQLWATDLTPAGTEQVADFPGGVAVESAPLPLVVGGRLLFVADDGSSGDELWTLTITGGDPPPPPGPWLVSDAVPGFEAKVRISAAGLQIAGSLEPVCIPETACVSGAVPGRSEVFIRVIGPRPNGFLWPTLVKFTTSRVEVWVRQVSTGVVRYYLLEGARPGFDELPGLFDRLGFEP